MITTRYRLAAALALAALAAAAQTKPGIENLRESGFKLLEGKRVGLITNATGVDNQLKSTVDILWEADNVELVALFGPEHGVRGDIHAGDAVGDGTDPATGVKVYSLFGKTRKPTPEMLEQVDVMVYDIQDIGCRSYTFISTMGLAMEACAELGKEFVVLDRPNPLGGNKVEGCVVEDGYYSFVSQFPIPYLYGLTPGELALLLNGEGMLAGGVKVDLTVVPMTGWKREMSFGDTGMPWLIPTPHIPTAKSAAYYPATGILGELYAVSIGVGYTLPFKLVCANWVDAEAFSARMTALNLPGVMFRPIHIKPFYQTLQNGPVDMMQDMHGVEIYLTDTDAAQLTLIQFYALETLADMYPDKLVFSMKGVPKRLAMFDKVCGTDQIRKLFTKRYKVADMADYWNKDADSFKATSAKYYLYH